MVLSTVIAAAGLAVAGVGAVMSYSAAKSTAKAQEQSLAAQQQAEGLRQQQMNLDASRRKREIVRASMAARSAALAQTTAQGAAGAGGSSLAGAYGAIAGRAGTNFSGVDQNQQIGNAMFATHQTQLSAYRSAAQSGAMGAMGAGLMSLGGMAVNNAGTFGKVGSYFMGNSKGPTNVGSATGWSR